MIPTGISHLEFKQHGDHYTWTKVGSERGKRARWQCCECPWTSDARCNPFGTAAVTVTVIALRVLGRHHSAQHHCGQALVRPARDDEDHQPRLRRHLHAQVHCLLVLHKCRGEEMDTDGTRFSTFSLLFTHSHTHNNTTTTTPNPDKARGVVGSVERLGGTQALKVEGE